MAPTNDRPITTEFMKFLLHPEANERFMEKGGFLTPHKFVDTSYLVIHLEVFMKS